MFLPYITALLYATFVSASTVELCDNQATANSSTARYTYSTDVLATDNSGAQCMIIDLTDNVAADSSTAFTATWKWDGSGSSINATHSFPNLQVNLPNVLPIPVDNITVFPITVDFSFYSGNVYQYRKTTNDTDLANLDVIAAVYLNIFLDEDANNSTNLTDASHVVVIWQAAYGGATPLGWTTVGSVTRPTFAMAGIDYTLYAAQNALSQTVYSWYPNTNTSQLTAQDVSPLLNYLWRNVYIPSDMYVGAIQWGNDARHSTANVTFDVYTTTFDITAGTPNSVSSIGEKTSKPPTFGGLVVVVVVALVMFGVQ